MSHHEEHRGHEETNSRCTEKKDVYLLSFNLRALRVLRGELNFLLTYDIFLRVLRGEKYQLINHEGHRGHEGVIDGCMNIVHSCDFLTSRSSCPSW